MIAKKVEAFFQTVENMWAVIPGYAKVFVYSTISSVVGLAVAGELDWQVVLLIVLANLGIYKGPRMIAEQTRRTLL